MTPLELVENQFEAYNARDLTRFLPNFSETVKVYRMPAAQLAIDGKAAMAEFYATQRFCHMGLRAELKSRIIMGNKIFDHELIWGIGSTPVEMVVAFEVQHGLIQTMWSFPA